MDIAIGKKCVVQLGNPSDTDGCQKAECFVLTAEYTGFGVLYSVLLPDGYIGDATAIEEGAVFEYDFKGCDLYCTRSYPRNSSVASHLRYNIDAPEELKVLDTLKIRDGVKVEEDAMPRFFPAT